MKIRHGFEFAAFWFLTRIVQLMPARVADWIAAGLGRLGHAILASRRRIAFENLKRAFQEEKSDSELKAITKEVFVNISRTSVEFCRQPVLGLKGVLEIIPESSGKEHISRALEEGRGLIFLMGHFGNWELLGAWLSASGFPIDFLVGQQHNPYVNKLFNNLRSSTGAGIIPVGVAARHVLKSLKANRVVALVSDQHSTSGAAVVNFFGRPAATPKGGATFAVKVGCPIILGSLVREKYNRHRAVIGTPIYPPDSGDGEKDIIEMTQAYTAQLEAMVRKYPDQWMWTHRRWKLNP